MTATDSTKSLTQRTILLSKIALCAAVLMLVSACGGQIPRLPHDGSTDPASPSIITSDQVFSNVAQTWTFKDGFGCELTIEIMPVDANHSVWHYKKICDSSYWAIGVRSAELRFNLERDTAGNWYSTGGTVNFPFGCPWCAGPVLNTAYPVNTLPGQQRPYLILAASTGFSYSTIFDDVTPIATGVLYTQPNAIWSLSASNVNGEYISDQREGSCVHERWHFAAGRGLVKIEPLDSGNCLGLDPRLTMVRTN